MAKLIEYLPTDKQVKKLGKTYNRLTVIGFAGIDANKNIYVQAKCICGKSCVSPLGRITSGLTVSCGCKRRETTADKNRTHGKTGTDEYRAWKAMKSRCYTVNRKDSKHYRQAGVEVDKVWRTNFERFLQDVGKKPSPKHSLDRIDPHGNYEPGNVRWATWKEQRANRRK